MKTQAPPARLVRQAGALLLLILLLPAASAHAVLQSADPAPNGRVDEGATRVTIRFTEDVERDYTGADVLDLQGESWAAGPVVFDEKERNVIHLPVRPLTSGIYAANWKALSVDTHTTRGSFVFAVGNATLRPGQYAVDASDPRDQDPAAVMRDGFARFAFYAGLFLVVGIPLFALRVLRENAPPRALFSTAAAFGVVGALGALIVLLFLGDRIGSGLVGAAATTPGRSLVLRASLTLAASLACVATVLRPALWRRASYAAIALGALAILATATGSHAAATKEGTTLLVAADALHLAMGAVWVGGIVAFAHVAWGRSALEVGAMVHRFSPLAIGSVVLLLATGSAASLAHMPCAGDLSNGLPCLKELRTERYVQLVALKLALMLPLVALGAFHKFHAGPRLARDAYSPRAFRRLLQVEAGIMAIVLGAAGILAASAPPAGEVEAAEVRLPYVEMDDHTEKSHVILQVSPNPVTVGIQKVVVIVHPLGPQLPNSTIVQLKVWPAGEREPDVNVDVPRVTPNEWEIEEGLFTSAGEWNVVVLLQRPDEFAKIPFTISVVNPS